MVHPAAGILLGRGRQYRGNTEVEVSGLSERCADRLRKLTLQVLLTIVVSAGMATAGINEWTSNGPEGGIVYALAVDPIVPTTLYAGATGGVFKSIDGGTNWTQVNSGLPGATVLSLTVDPTNPATVYAATDNGLFKTKTGGSTWTDIGAGLNINAVFGVVVDPRAPSTLYTFTSTDLFRTTTGGGPWTSVGGLPAGYLRGFLLDPLNPGVFYSLTSAGVFKTTTGGSSWHQIYDGSVRFLVMDSARPATLYAGISGTVFRTTDGGASWEYVGNGLPLSVSGVATDPRSPDTVYTWGDNSLYGGIYKTTDGGATWVSASAGLTHLGVSTVATDPLAPDRLYAGTFGGGVQRSTNGGSSWVPANTGFRSTIVESIAVDPTDPTTVYAAVWVGGAFRSDDAAGSWRLSNPNLLNLHTIIVDPNAPSTLYVATTGFGGVSKSTDGGTTWRVINAGLANEFPSALVISRSTPATLYLGGTGVFRSSDGGEHWERTGLTDEIWALAVHPAVPATLYASTTDGVFKSTTFGNTWNALGIGTTDRPIGAFAIDPSRPETVYAGSGLGVLKSTDGGISWAPMNFGLTTLSVTVLTVDPVNPSVLYAGTFGGGVFKSVDGGGRWDPLNPGLTVLNVTDVAIDPSDPRTVHAATYGGGVFSIQQVAVPLPPRRLAYYALGDSVASGHGLPGGSGQTVGTCQLSPKAYPRVAFDRLRSLPDYDVILRHLACTRAKSFTRLPSRRNRCFPTTSTECASDSQCPPGETCSVRLTDLPQQVDQLQADAAGFRSDQITIVSVTAGADDFDLVEELSHGTHLCLPDADFKAWLERTSDLLEQSLERQLRRILRINPNVSVIATDYFSPFKNGGGFFALLEDLARFQINPVGQLILPAEVFAEPNCLLIGRNHLYNRAQRVVGRVGVVSSLNQAVSSAVSRVASDPAVRGRLSFLSVYDSFLGHEGAQPNCGPGAPNEMATYVQYPGFVISLISAGDLFVQGRNFQKELEDGDDCIHPNQAGAMFYADGDATTPGVHDVVLGLLPRALPVTAPQVVHQIERTAIVGAGVVAPGEGDCCTSRVEPGCAAISCQACVCALDGFCCETGWDVFCSDAAKSECADSCPCGPPVPTRTPTPSPVPGGDCCAVHDGSGCDDAACQACVCGADPDCCEVPWDTLCVSLVGGRCAAECPCGPTPTPTPVPAPGGDCCAPHAGSSCDGSACAACVCAADPHCCASGWDEFCVITAARECFAGCGCLPTPTETELPTPMSTPTPTGTLPTVPPVPTPGGDCCSGHAGPACDSFACQSCVCTGDSFCCELVWDQLCVGVARGGCETACGCPAPTATSSTTSLPTAATSPSPTPTPSMRATLTPPVSRCFGDCSGDQRVTVDELLLGVRIAMQSGSSDLCSALDGDASSTVEINELVAAVSSALRGCALGCAPSPGELP